MMPEIRRELYQRITAVVKEGIKEYYEKFPERFEDERSDDALEHSFEGLRKIKAVLDEYDIKRRKVGS